ncbi:MAG: hypothetical protein ACKPKO_41255, partial [Candidatus Fonsibacter sp.]
CTLNKMQQSTELNTDGETVRHGPYLGKPPLASTHPFITIIASTYDCYTEQQTNQSMYQLKGTQPTTTITNELPTLRRLI